MSDTRGEPEPNSAFWRQIVASIPDGVVVVDAAGLHVEVNDAMARLTGFTRDELVGSRPPFPYWPAEELARIHAAFVRAQSGETGNMDLVFCHKDGTRIPVLVHPASINDAGRTLRVATVKDMRHHHALTAELIASRERWRSIAENPFDFVVEIDRQYRFLYVNHVAPGLTMEQLIGKLTPFDFVDSYQQPAMRIAFDQAFAGMGSQQYDVFVPSINKWFASIVGPVLTGTEVTSLSILTRDVTESKLAVEALKQSERRLQLALAGGDVGAFEVDLPAGRTYTSPRLAALLGYSPDSVVDDTLDGFVQRIHPEDTPSVFGQMCEVVQTDGERSAASLDHELRLRTASGEYRWFHVRGRVFEVAGQSNRHLSGFVTDITTRKQADVERVRLEAHIQHAQRLETLGTLASGVAHDFNNLLVPILGNTELLMRQLPTLLREFAGEGEQRDFREYIEDIRQAAVRGRELVGRLLTFGRPSGGTDDRGTATRVVPVVLEAVQLLRRAIHPNVELSVRIHADQATVLANEGQLIQVITNLGVNASQAIGDRPGHIWLSLERTVLDESFATQHGWSGSAVHLHVGDDGPGMPPETLERAFDPFFTTKPVGQGSGLGLASVHAIVRQHGGVIVAESTVGVGTQFDLYFPALDETTLAEPAPVEQPPTVTSVTGCRILLVDDYPMVLKVFEDVLTDGGHSVVAVGSAAAAIAQMQANPGGFDVVVTDHSMPKMTGIELAQTLLELEPGLPVILVSGLGDRAFSGPSPRNLRAIVAKPPSSDELLGAVERVSLIAKR